MTQKAQPNQPIKAAVDLILLLSFFGTTISLVFGQLWRIPLANGVGAIYPHDFFIGLFFIIKLLQHLHLKLQITNHKSQSINYRVQLTRYKLELFFFFWLVVNLLRELITQQNYLMLAYNFRIGYYAGFTFLVHRQLKTWQKSNQRWSSYHWFLILISWMAIFGLWQYLLFYDLRALLYLGWDEHLGRLTSTFLDPNFAGFVLATGLIYWLAIRQKWWMHRWFWWVGSLISLIGLSLTFSRASYLVAFLGLGLVNLLSKNKKTRMASLATIAVLALVILIVPKPHGEGGRLLRSASIQARITYDLARLCQTLPPNLSHNIKLCANSNQKYPSLIPANTPTTNLQLARLAPHNLAPSEINNLDQARVNPPYVNHALWPNNLFILIYQQVGLIGLALSLILMLRWARRLWQKSKVATILCLMLLIHAQFNNTVFEPFVFLIFWGTVAEVLRFKLDI